jgi:hypothetical protein
MFPKNHFQNIFHLPNKPTFIWSSRMYSDSCMSFVIALRTGSDELQAKEHGWLQHQIRFTWFSWRGDKLCPNGLAIYRPKCVISSWRELYLTIWETVLCIDLTFFDSFLGELLWQHMKGVSIFGIENFSHSVSFFIYYANRFNCYSPISCQ